MKLMDWGFANFMAVPIAKEGEVLERLKVTKGTEKEVQLVAAQDLSLVVGKGQNKNLQKKVVAETTLTAPVNQGEKYGELVVMNDGKELGRVDLIAEKTIEKASFFRIIQNMFNELFAIAR
jgi:D-alanyl-D-alanine carboxypeptidase (penicillin-binding protein 5/6)